MQISLVHLTVPSMLLEGSLINKLQGAAQSADVLPAELEQPHLLEEIISSNKRELAAWIGIRANIKLLQNNMRVCKRKKRNLTIPLYDQLVQKEICTAPFELRESTKGSCTGCMVAVGNLCRHRSKRIQIL